MCALLLLAGCGGGVETPTTGSQNTQGDDDSTGGVGGAEPASDGGGGVPGSGGAAGGPDSGAGGSTFVDPGCPERPPVQGMMECDPFATVSSCGPGDRCVPYVEYADDCGTEEFGTRCSIAGAGVQGDECIEEPCSAGHVCVTTGEGTQCARLCRIVDGQHDCPPGLRCRSLDVEGFWTCS